MKFLLPDLKLGESVEARVVELLDNRELLLNVGGDLVRVGNESGHPVRSGQKIELIVTALRPLQFRVATHPAISKEKGPRKIDVSV